MGARENEGTQAVLTAKQPQAGLANAAVIETDLESVWRACQICPVPALVFTGDDFTVRTNAPLLELCGLPPGSDGRPGRQFWDEAWPRIAPVLEAIRGNPVDIPLQGVELRIEGGPLPPGVPALPLRCVPICAGGIAGGVTGIFACADREYGEAAVQRAVAAAAAAKSRFMAAASHDLRQPFQAMRLFLGLLTERVVDDKARHAAGMLGAAMESGERLLNALLDISLLDAGTVKVEPEVFALDTFLARLLEEIRPQAETKGLRIKAHLRPVLVCCDPVLLERIVRNLLSNALRYTRTGGILLAMRWHGPVLQVEVWDTGCGIPHHELSAIFDEFHQIGNPERDRDRGLGLGLAIVRRLSALLGTRVDVRSQVGRGSMFAMTVPLAGPGNRPDEAVAPQPAPAVLAGAVVLVVDDDEMVLFGLKLTLESWGCRVVAAGDMREVMAGVDTLASAPDVIVSDLRLRANLSGFEVIDRVRRVFRRPVPAIVLSGETSATALAEAARYACHFLHKPIEPDQLKEVLSRTLREGRG
jgi:signal transduction histidine kinase/ActR/RegA family two-component response regulator